MPRAGLAQAMVGTADKVKMGLTELRSLVLGAEILLGFQYEALFHKGFWLLSVGYKRIELLAFALLVATVVLMIAPSSHHTIAENNEATARQSRFTDQMIWASLLAFAAAIGLNLALVTHTLVGETGATLLGAGSVVVALSLWFGVELMAKRPVAPPPAFEPTPLKEKIKELMTETRIVLPGVQALLGFQLAAYFTEPFDKLAAEDRWMHTLGLVLLVISMILLMAPAPFHRIAEGGENTPRMHKVGDAMLLWGLGALGLAMAADLFIAAHIVLGSGGQAVAAGGTAALASLIVWFLLPVWRRGQPSH